MSSPVALWYMRHHAPGYEICDSEEDAAGLAWGMRENGGAAIEGIQFPDGRTVRIEDWELYAETERRLEQAQSARSTEPPRPQRHILDPFGNRALSVDASEPAWLGKTGAPAVRQGGGYQ